MTPHGRGGTFMSRPCKRSVPSSPQVAVQDPPGPDVAALVGTDVPVPGCTGSTLRPWAWPTWGRGVPGTAGPPPARQPEVAAIRDDVVIQGAGPPEVVAVLDRDGHPRPVGHLASTLVRWDGLASGADLSGLPWHLGFAHAEIAVLVERIHSRSAAGSTAGRASTGGAVVPALVEPGARGRPNPGALALRSHTAYSQAR